MNIRQRLDKIETAAAQLQSDGLTCGCPPDPSMTWADESPLEFAGRWSGVCQVCGHPKMDAAMLEKLRKVYGAATGHQPAALPGLA